MPASLTRLPSAPRLLAVTEQAPVVAGAREQLLQLVAGLRHPQSDRLRAGYLYRVGTRRGTGMPLFERKNWLAMAFTRGAEKRSSNEALLRLVQQAGLDGGKAFQALRAYMEGRSTGGHVEAPDIQQIEQLLRAVLDERLEG
jgi:hypothetical protein